MKLSKGLLFLMVAFVFVLTGCNNGVDLGEEPKSMEVERRVGDSDTFEDFKTITDKKDVKEALDIVTKVNWEEAKVSMSTPPAYRFVFPNPNAKSIQYEVWISPNKTNLELTHGGSAYTKLSEEDSAVLYKIITGFELKDLK